MPNIYCDSDYSEDRVIANDSGVAQDITNWNFEFECVSERAPSDCSKRIFLTVGSGLTLQDPTNGVLRISMTAAQTKQFGPGVGRLRLWRTDGMRVIFAEGSATFEGRAFDA